MALVNRVRHETGSAPTILPGLELRDGVPIEAAHDRRHADAADDAERRSKSRSSVWRSIILRVPDGELHFALLSDWTDAADRDRAPAMRRFSRPRPRASRV